MIPPPYVFNYYVFDLQGKELKNCTEYKKIHVVYLEYNVHLVYLRFTCCVKKRVYVVYR